MNNDLNMPFLPTLTVMVDYGNAPFLWLVDRPHQGGVGRNLCDGAWWHELVPMSEELWKRFAGWAIEFDRTHFDVEGEDTDSWDWIAFHARGLQLARNLKVEVGDAYRVVYEKPCEDPNHRIDERTEILASGELVPLPPCRNSLLEPLRFCECIVSGGQTGADRGALDFAIRHGFTHGGWAPKGRQAEDGLIPKKYQLTELADGGYRQRIRRNVKDSDGTLIVNFGELDGLSLATQIFTQHLGKPYLVVQVDRGVTVDVAFSILGWLREHSVKTLNVAGPCESKRPGIHRLTLELLEAVDASLHLD